MSVRLCWKMQVSIFVWGLPKYDPEKLCAEFVYNRLANGCIYATEHDMFPSLSQTQSGNPSRTPPISP